MPGLIAVAINFQGIQAVALPLVQEFSYSKEIEDRVLAPVPVWLIGLEKIVAGALQSILASRVVFPIVYLVHAHGAEPHVARPRLAALRGGDRVRLAARVVARPAASARVLDPRKITLLFSVVVIPLTFLGCVYYPWAACSRSRGCSTLVL